MKKQLLAFSFVLGFWFCGSAQWVSIPDTNFGNWLYGNGFSQCLLGDSSSGWQMDTTCNEVINSYDIDCSYGGISDLTGIQYFKSLQYLACYNNMLTSLPELPKTLLGLGCSENQILFLPILPDSLNNLNCNHNQLSLLPSLPNSLKTLWAFNNHITILPALPALLSDLELGHNQISVMPSLPSLLLTFLCDDNQLTSLPSLPNSLIFFDCSYNQLTTLPILPSSLNYLACTNNQLTAISALPDSLSNFDCYDNPMLTCLPELNKVRIFSFNNTSITCLPNYPQSNTYSTPTLSSVPLCDSNNINGCSYCHSYFSLFPDTANPGIYNGYNLSYGSNLTSYLWEFGDGATSTQQYPSHIYAQAGQYYVCLTAGSADCTNTYCDSSYLVFKTENGLMSQLNILNPTTTAIQANNPATSGKPFRINPNPASSSVNVSVDEEMIGSNLTVYDITGRKMAAVQLSVINNQLSIARFASGVYFVTVENEKGRVTKKLVIEK